MAEILGLGLTHAPTMTKVPEEMTQSLRRTLAGKNLPPHLRDPKNWPQKMQEEWGDDQGATFGRQFLERIFAATRELRRRLDEFKPDLVVIYGDDQYENFTEDLVPPFCVYILDEMEAHPYAAGPASATPRRNAWGEPSDKVFRYKGSAKAARHLTNHLWSKNIHIPYAYRMRYKNGLAHAFSNTLLLLDVDRKGFDYPVLPFHINCYGGDLIRQRGGTIAPTDMGDDTDPPAPSSAVCYDLGREVGRAFAASPWRTAIIGSSSWGHGFLTKKNNWLYPDHPSDRMRLAELREGRYACWRDLTQEQLQDAGQHELLNWTALAGAMIDLNKKPEIIDFAETYVLNTNSCFAVFN